MTLKENKIIESVFPFLDQSILFLLGIFLFINPIPHITAVKEICFYSSLSLAVLLGMTGWRKYFLNTPLTLPFAIFFAWSVFGLFYAINKGNSIHDIYAHLLKYIVLYFLIVNHFNSKRRFNLLSWIIVASATVFSIGGMLYLYAYLHAGRNLSEIFFTKFGFGFDEIHINTVGVVIIPGILLSIQALLEKRSAAHKVLLAICILSMFAALMLTQSRSTLLAMVLSSFVLMYRSWKIFLVITIILVIGISATHMKDRLMREKVLQTDRLKISYAFLEIIKDYPITGIGFGMQSYADEAFLKKFNDRVPEIHRQPVPHKAPHNLILDITTRLGLIGLALFSLILARFIRMGWRAIKQDDSDRALCLLAIFSAILVQGMFENILSGPPAIMVFLLFSLMTIFEGLKVNRGVFNSKNQ